MKFNRSKLVAAVLSVMLLAAVAAVSQTVKRAHMHGGGMFGGPGLHFMTRYLDLSDAQQAQIKDIMAKEKPAMKPLMQQLAQTWTQERALVEAGTFDEAQARTLATQRAQATVELSVQRMRIESEMYQVLNADQKTKLNEMLDKRQQRFNQHLQPQPPPTE